MYGRWCQVIIHSLQLLEAAAQNLDPVAVKLANHFSKERDMAAVEIVLNALHPNLIPPLNLELYNTSAKNVIDRALAALIYLSRIVACFPYSASDVQAFKTQFYRIVIERWNAISQWMTFIIARSAREANRHYLLSLCAQTLESFIYVMTNVGRETFILRLKSGSKEKRRRIVASLVRRPTQMVAVAEDRHHPIHYHADTRFATRGSVTNSLRYLVHASAVLFVGDTYILKTFLREGFVFEYAKAFAMLAENEDASKRTQAEASLVPFWETLTAAMIYLVSLVLPLAPDPNSSLSRAIDGGLLTLEDIFQQVLGVTIGYMTVSRVYRAVLDASRGDIMTKVVQYFPPSENKVFRRFNCRLERGKYIFGEQYTSVSMCSNLTSSTLAMKVNRMILQV
ncbi:hypothetical protein EST38_g10801 [Candolleomyces aberdarensis]|uniref:Uncharacterized protein n=1 Tax=Candolleomyces aberdarensis TaxID=2316362 RepID=A0A4Q2D9B8_9AGAR|nr:hypothetical protein EST38_g10801 [Candolleomyces aberdarensis]